MFFFWKNDLALTYEKKEKNQDINHVDNLQSWFFFLAEIKMLFDLITIKGIAWKKKHFGDNIPG